MTIREGAKILELPIVEHAVRFRTLAEAEAFLSLCDCPFPWPAIVYDFEAMEYCVYLADSVAGI